MHTDALLMESSDWIGKTTSRSRIVIGSKAAYQKTADSPFLLSKVKISRAHTAAFLWEISQGPLGHARRGS